MHRTRRHFLAAWLEAEASLAPGDVAGADVVIEKLDNANHHPSIDSFWHATYNIAHRVRYAIRRGNLEEAAKWGEQLPDMADMMLADRPVVVRLLMAHGKREAAAMLLLELYDSAVKLGATVMVLWIRAYQTIAASTEASGTGIPGRGPDQREA